MTMAGSEISQKPRVPAWKRLGLKLAYQDEPRKRKLDDLSSEGTQDSNASDPALKRKKSVTFAHDVKNDDGSQTEKALSDFIAQQQGQGGQFTSREANQYSTAKVHPANLEVTSKGKSSAPAKKDKSRTREETGSVADSHTSEYLRYLIHFGADKTSWKFRKHDQTLLLKYTFSERRIPSQHFDTYLKYIDGLQGQARQRLAERAHSVVNETGHEDDNSMEQVENRDAARTTALKQQLLNTKIRLREAQDDADLHDDTFRAKYTKRRRAEEILKVLADVSVQQSVPAEQDQKTEALSTDQSPAQRQPARTLANPGKRQRMRLKKARTGVPEDDNSSVSSVEMEPFVKLVTTAQVDGGQDVSEESSDSSSDDSSTTSGDEDSTDSDDSSVDTEADSSSDSDEN